MPRALIALMTLVVALSSGDQRMSPEETVRRYCALEFDGQTLTPEGRSKRAALLASAPLAPDPSGDRLVIVRDYVVKRDRVEAHAASIVADYAMFGTLDASLRFTRVEGRRPQAPTRQRRDFTLVSGGVRDRRSPDDRARAASGRMPWKIESHRDPFGHYVGLDAGIRYVTAAREASPDPAIRGNADRTLRTLTRLAAGAPSQPESIVSKTPQAVVEGFCTLDADGGRMTPAGTRALSPLCVQPVSLYRGTITVVRDFGVSLASIADDNTAGVAAEYIALFEMDSESANIEPGRLPPGGIKVRNDFTLILTNGPPPRALGDNVAGEAGASPVWKIDRPVPPPHITVGTAIRYVTELRDKTTDDRIRKNAVRALASLKLQK